MILGYLLNLLQEAVAANDYSEQSKIAGLLIPYEQQGLITNQDIVDIVLNA